MKPYADLGDVQLYHGDCREILPLLELAPDACVTDPPYGSTSAAWDRWPDGWVDAVSAVLPSSASLWSFGTAAMFLRHAGEFAGWKYAQEALWLKRNGTGPGSRDRLMVVHEWAYHWYRGRWTDLYHEWERERSGGIDKSTRRQAHAAAHRRPDRANSYVDDGYRQPRSVRVLEASSAGCPAPGRPAVTVRCLRCRRVLHNPEWAARRLGRRCAELLGLAARRPAAPVAVKAAPKAAQVETSDGQLELFEMEEVITP